MDVRELKALELAARTRISFVDGVWLVPSQTSPATWYRVSLTPPGCECEDFLLRGEECKHIIAARLVCERERGGTGPAITVDELPKKRTYRQHWPVYNEAQQQEKDRLQVLLADLCRGVAEPPHSKSGPRPVALADRLFSVCFKVWSTLSSRRFNGDLQEAHRRGHLSRALHPNKVNCFMGQEELTPWLRALVVHSALPLRAVESEFAVDSSGFTTSRLIRWFDSVRGVERREHDFVKVHLACGVHTHVTTAAAIYNRDSADGPVLPELVNKTAERFRVDEVSADKAYLSVENVEAVFAAGGLPFIAPKSNTTGGVGGLFEKMYHYYQYRRDDFLAHYHQRSNAESTFSAVKRKFGDYVRSRTPRAMVNEVLAKLVCNNLCCVILSQCELGIEAEFWPEEPAAGRKPAAILPLKRIGPG